jgi:hypothetical protein
MPADGGRRGPPRCGIGDWQSVAWTGADPTGDEIRIIRGAKCAIAVISEANSRLLAERVGFVPDEPASGDEKPSATEVADGISVL